MTQVDSEVASGLAGLMRDGDWAFQRLGDKLSSEMISRAEQLLAEGQDAPLQEMRERLNALPIYRLSALALKGADRSVCMDAADGSSMLLDCGPLESDLPQFWRAVLHSFNTNPYSPISGSIHYCQPTPKHHRAFDAALGLLAERLPATHAALMRWIQRVMVVQGEAGEDAVAGSSPRFLGCILVPAKYFERPAAALAGELVHEMAHQELFVLNAYDRLVQPSADNVLRYSIFAGVRRPTIGRLHAAHAMFRMIQVARATEQGSRILRGKLRLTLRTFRSDDLTPFAQRIVQDVYTMSR